MSAEQMQAFGLTPDDLAGDAFGIYPDNWSAFLVFEGMATQWRVGFSGPVGLDYNVLPWVIEQVGVPNEDRAGLFEDVRVMEAAALGEMREK